MYPAAGGVPDRFGSSCEWSALRLRPLAWHGVALEQVGPYILDELAGANRHSDAQLQRVAKRLQWLQHSLAPHTGSRRRPKTLPTRRARRLLTSKGTHQVPMSVYFLLPLWRSINGMPNATSAAKSARSFGIYPVVPLFALSHSSHHTRSVIPGQSPHPAKAKPSSASSAPEWSKSPCFLPHMTHTSTCIGETCAQ